MEPTHEKGETASSPAISPSLIVHLRDTVTILSLNSVRESAHHDLAFSQPGVRRAPGTPP